MPDVPVQGGWTNTQVDTLTVNTGLTGSGIGVGTFTATAAATTTITDAGVTANAQVVLFPTNGMGGELLAAKSCYVSAISAGSFKFIVSATGAGAPGGDETFGYIFLAES